MCERATNIGAQVGALNREGVAVATAAFVDRVEDVEFFITAGEDVEAAEWAGYSRHELFDSKLT